jgi:hypothetical protein
MLGFELEVSLPVTNQTGQLIPGDTELGVTGNHAVRIVTDKRSLPQQGGAYSNIEFVTSAVSVIGAQVVAGRAAVINQLGEVRRVRDNFYAAGAVALSVASGGVNYTVPAGTTALLNPNNGYYEEAGQPGQGDGLYPHYSVGIPLRSSGAFLDRVRAAAPGGAGVYLPRARFRLAQAPAYATDIVNLFGQTQVGQQVNDTRALHGYLQLAFTQICAMADYLALGQNRGQIKNGTVVLSRSSLASAYALLGVAERGYLQAAVQLPDNDNDNPVTHLATYQEQTETMGVTLEFQEGGTRQIRDDTPEISLIDYATAAFNGVDDIDQELVFGGMLTLAPHVEQGVSLIPVELRTLGARLKDWQEVQTDLTNLCAWAETARQNA